MSLFLARWAQQLVLDVRAVISHFLDQTPELPRVIFVIEQPYYGVRARVATLTKRAKVALNHVPSGLHAYAEARRRLVAADRHYPGILKEIVHA